MRRVLRVVSLIALLVSAAPALGQASPTLGPSPDLGTIAPELQADPGPAQLALSHKARRYQRLRVTGIALLVSYGVATFATALALSSAADGCYEGDSFCMKFPFGAYFGGVALLGSPLLISGLTTYGIGKRRLRQLEKVTPGLAFERGAARLVVQARF